MIPDSLLQGRSELFKRSWLTGLAVSLLVVQACGSGDGKKRVQNAGDGGAGGEAGSPDMGQDAAGAAGTPPVNDGGTGGTGDIIDVGGTGGVGGSEEPTIPVAGAGGEAPLPPNPELLFSVKYGAHGLADTAISKQGTPENFIYTTNTGSQDAVDGTNAVKVTGASLGLDAADAIVAFAEEQVEPQTPMFVFTLADGSEGAYGTRSYQAYNSSGTEEGNLYYSDGIAHYDGGEGISNLGYNGLTATQTSLGLTTAEGIDANPDDLRGLAIHDANKPLEELYFSVYTDAVGATDSAVDLVDSDHKGCTLFKSSLDGTNSVAFTCEQLGLTTTDQIDALAIFEGDDGPTVIFSVTSASQGLPGTALGTLQEEGDNIGATLFRSTGNNTNTVYLTGRGLGLDEYYFTYDDVDGVAIINQPKLTGTNYDTCQLTYDPYAATNGGGLLSIAGTRSVGDDVLVVLGTLDQAGGGARYLAYDATTCQFLQQVDLPTGFDDPQALAIVPLPGWTASKPLEKVEYFRAENETYSLTLRRFDVTGVLVNSYPISNTAYTSAMGLFYEPTADQLVLLNTYNSGSFSAFPRPAIDATGVEPAYRKVTRPCLDQGDVGGIDSDGNLYLARSQETVSDFRVCGFRSDGEMLPAPYSWSSDVDAYLGGFIVPGGSHFLLHSGEPMWIERSNFPKL
jgi:hypothetical protein